MWIGISGSIHQGEIIFELDIILYRNQCYIGWKQRSKGSFLKQLTINFVIYSGHIYFDYSVCVSFYINNLIKMVLARFMGFLAAEMSSVCVYRLSGVDDST